MAGASASAFGVAVSGSTQMLAAGVYTTSGAGEGSKAMRSSRSGQVMTTGDRAATYARSW